MVSAAIRRRETPEIIGIAAGCAAGLAALDTYHVLRGRISPVYLIDATLQIAALTALRARPRRDDAAHLADSPG